MREYNTNLSEDVEQVEELFGVFRKVEEVDGFPSELCGNLFIESIDGYSVQKWWDWDQ